MFARTLIVFAMSLGVLVSTTSAQEGPGRFDPVVYMKMFSMGDRYSDSRFLSIRNTVTTFENYMIDKADIISFTVKQQDSSGTGWTMWLDFAMDRLGGKRLIRVFAQKPVPEQPVEQYKNFTNWFETVLEEKLGTEVKNEEYTILRKYEGKPGYEATVRLTPSQDDGKRYITIAVEEAPMD